MFDFPAHDELFDLMLLRAATRSKAVEAEATGNPLTFQTDLARPLKSLLIPFTPVQSGTGDPSPQNIRSILPWNGLTVEHFDENLLSINRTSGQTTQGITFTPIKQDNKTVAVKVEGTRSNTNPFFNLDYVNGTTVSISPGTYKIFGAVPGVRFQVFYIDAGGAEKMAGTDTGEGATVTIPNDALASWCRLHVNVDTYVNAVVYPIIMSADSSVTVYPVSFPSPVYGGTLDVVSGVLTVEWAGIALNGTEANWSNYNQGTAFSVPIIGMTTDAYKTVLCDRFAQIKNITSFGVYASASNDYAYFINATDIEGVTDLASWKAYLAENPMGFAYKLATPQEITLTQEQITALVGNNTIWSDADGSMTAVYLKKA